MRKAYKFSNVELKYKPENNTDNFFKFQNKKIENILETDADINTLKGFKCLSSNSLTNSVKFNVRPNSILKMILISRGYNNNNFKLNGDSDFMSIDCKYVWFYTNNEGKLHSSLDSATKDSLEKLRPIEFDFQDEFFMFDISYYEFSHFVVTDEMVFDFVKDIHPETNFITGDNRNVEPKIIRGNMLSFGKNSIIGSEDEKIILLDDNYLVDVNMTYTKKLYLYDKPSPLEVRTFIKEVTKKDDNYIVVDNPKYFLRGNIIRFSTTYNAFAMRKVTGVVGNKIYFNEPLTQTDETYVKGMVFAFIPKEYERFETKLAKDVKAYRRRVYFEDANDNLHLRDCLVGDFNTKIDYFDNITRLAVLNDLTQSKIPAGTSVVCHGYKYGDAQSFVIGVDKPNLYVGQEVNVEGQKYNVKGFQDAEIYFEEIEDGSLNGKNGTTEALPKELLYSSERNLVNLEYIPFKLYDNYIGIKQKSVTNNNVITSGDTLLLNNIPYLIDRVRIEKGVIWVSLLGRKTNFIFDNTYIQNSKIVNRNHSKQEIIDKRNDVMDIVTKHKQKK